MTDYPLSNDAHIAPVVIHIECATDVRSSFPPQCSLEEVGRKLKRQLDAGDKIDTLALIEWVIQAASKTATEPNRHLIEIPDRFAVARWSRDADEATIARSVLATLKYEPHASDTTKLRQSLESVAS